MSPKNRNRVGLPIRNYFKPLTGATIAASLSMALLSGPAGNVAAGSTTRATSGKTSGTTSVTADLKFYKGKTIDFITNGAPGSGSDVQTRIIATAIGIYLHCTVAVVDNANTIAAQDQAAAANPDGLTIGNLSTNANLENIVSNTTGINFQMNEVPIVGAIPSPPAELVVTTASGYTSFLSLIDSPTPFKVLDVLTGAGNLDDRALFGGYQAKAQIVTGFSSGSALQAGLIQNEGAVGFNEVPSFSAAVISGVLRPVLLSQKVLPGVTDYAAYENVPTFAKFFAEHQPPTKAAAAALKEVEGFATDPTAFFAPRGTPKARLAALTSAIKWALANKSVRSQELTVGDIPGEVSAPTTESRIKYMVKHVSALSRFINYSYTG